MAVAPGETLIQFSHVKKAFGPKVIYSDLNLEIRRGETITIMGASGSGKSVMLKMLIGLLQADAGEILFDGRDIGKMNEEELTEVRRRIAYLFQGAALFDSLNVGENVAYGLREQFWNKMSDDEIEGRVAQSLELVGLPGIQSMRPSDLSGGMKKRVGLARTLALQPEVILYDEPTTGLDPINTARINHLILASSAPAPDERRRHARHGHRVQRVRSSRHDRQGPHSAGRDQGRVQGQRGTPWCTTSSTGSRRRARTWRRFCLRLEGLREMKMGRELKVGLFVILGLALAMARHLPHRRARAGSGSRGSRTAPLSRRRGAQAGRAGAHGRPRHRRGEGVGHDGDREGLAHLRRHVVVKKEAVRIRDRHDRARGGQGPPRRQDDRAQRSACPSSPHVGRGLALPVRGAGRRVHAPRTRSRRAR